MSYTAKATKTGNSRALRFESALFAAHPEFATGRFEADVIAPGRLLVRILDEETIDDTPDAVMDAFLAFLAVEMERRPQGVMPLTPEFVAAVDGLVAGVEYDPNEPLDNDFDLP